MLKVQFWFNFSDYSTKINNILTRRLLKYEKDWRGKRTIRKGVDAIKWYNRDIFREKNHKNVIKVGIKKMDSDSIKLIDKNRDGYDIVVEETGEFKAY